MNAFTFTLVALGAGTLLAVETTLPTQIEHGRSVCYPLRGEDCWHRHGTHPSVPQQPAKDVRATLASSGSSPNGIVRRIGIAVEHETAFPMTVRIG